MNQDLENRVSELERSHSTLNRVTSELVLHARDTDANVTILLGIARGQEHDVREMKADIAEIKADVSTIRSELETQFTAINQQLIAILARLSEQP